LIDQVFFLGLSAGELAGQQLAGLLRHGVTVFRRARAQSRFGPFV
jgi:hypothetical protein